MYCRATLVVAIIMLEGYCSNFLPNIAPLLILTLYDFVVCWLMETRKHAHTHTHACTYACMCACAHWVQEIIIVYSFYMLNLQLT